MQAAKIANTFLGKFGLLMWLLAVLATAIVQIHAFNAPKFAPNRPLAQEAPSLPDALSANALPTVSDISQTTLSMHSATITPIISGDSQRLMAAWFAGSKEGAKDVKIYAATLDLPHLNASDNAIWSKPVVILDRENLSKQSGTYIKKLGNPVLYQSKDGTVHLFVVATSYAGWAASKIYHLTSNTGEHFVFKQILPLSPFLNVSYLVRTPPVALADGGFYLPIYHELANKFELIVRFDKDGNLIAKFKPNQLKNVLQPAIAPISDSDCISLRRHRISEPLQVQECHNGGLIWDKPIATNINNDNNSINVIDFAGNTYAIHNQSQNDNSRFALWLSVLHKNQPPKNQFAFTIQPAFLVDKNADSEVSYPTTIALGDYMHIVYTYGRKSIRHLRLHKNTLAFINACANKNGKATHFIDQALLNAQATISTQIICERPSL